MQPDDPPPTPRQRLIANVIVCVFVLLLLGGGFWVADGVVRARKADDCLAQGSRRCFQIDTSTMRQPRE